MGIKEAYEAFLEARLPRDKLSQLGISVDREAVRSYAAQGHAAGEIRAALALFSPRLQGLSSEAQDAAMSELISYGAGENARALTSSLAEEMRGTYCVCQVKYAEAYAELLAPLDTAALSYLLQRGWPETEAQDCLRGEGVFARLVHDADSCKAYASQVETEVAARRDKEYQEELPEAEQALDEYLAASTEQYAKADRQLDFYREGEAAVYLLRVRGFMPETVRDVLESYLGKSGQDYHDHLRKLMAQSLAVQRAYLALDEAGSIEEARNPAEAYAAYLHQYMEGKQLKLLTFEDEQAVLREMREDEFPEQLLRLSILDKSPVAREAGRNKEKYVEALLLPESQPNIASISGNTGITPLDMYKGRLEQLQNEGRAGCEGTTEELRPVYDCLAVQSLLQKGLAEQQVTEALVQGNPKVPPERQEGYAQKILDKAQRLIKSRQNLLHRNGDVLPPGRSYLDLLALGFTAFSIYHALFQEKLALNPSLWDEMLRPEFDKHMAESCLARYPDFDRAALRGVVRESPRAILVERTPLDERGDYAEHVLAEAEALLSKAQAARADTEAMEAEYQKQYALASQGLEIDTSNERLAGQGALILLMNGMNELDIRASLLHNAPEQYAREPGKFADNILARVREAGKRILAIKACRAQAGQQETAEAAYMREMRSRAAASHGLRASQDIEAICALLLCGHKKEEVAAAVTARSPWAVMPGVGERYVQGYLMKRAANEITAAKDKLRLDKPRAREPYGTDIRQEYDWQRDNLQKRHSLLPYEMRMDELAAAALLQEGFQIKDIAKVLDEASPCRSQQANYGVAVARLVSKQVYAEAEVTHTESEETWAAVPTLVRTKRTEIRYREERPEQ